MHDPKEFRIAHLGYGEGDGCPVQDCAYPGGMGAIGEGDALGETAAAIAALGRSG
ncbi:MAG: hypothetical protein VKJ09_05535 [Leptolyngbya sp.]|nr:hypothetical protein [Leptolyngbya sp.]